ncbi:MAG: FAD-binding oxidoreductase [Bacteroidia bacterium]|jgi:ring-1,2-phenylacetyl-CoA epoxidase subunit PaaE|nr:FAD-binding oxidoreductase [Bacteroidia bacterium]
MERLPLVIAQIITQPNETKSFYFKTDSPLDFVAGQYLTLIATISGKEVRRTYSICSSPDEDTPFITVKRIDNGVFSRWLHDTVQVGQQLYCLPPNGQFTFVPNAQIKRSLFLIGAGTGIAPLRSMLLAALVYEPLSEITLVYSNRSPEHTLFLEELNTLQKQYPTRLNLVYLWSNAKNLSMARLNRDVLEKLVKQYVKHNREDALFYTCGPADYMLMCKIVLLGMGFEANQIKKETFVLPEDEADDDDDTVKIPTDTNTYTVHLHAGEKQYTLAVPYTETILDIGLKHGIDLPYSCKSGMCSTCVATRTNGTVRMDYNEVLTDSEVANGRILLCQSHPTSPDVIVTV